MIRHFKHPKTGQIQLLTIEDILNSKGYTLKMLQNKKVPIVYSEPPWGPITEKYWRSLANIPDSTHTYEEFIKKWCELISQVAGLKHIFCQQSYEFKYRNIFNSAIKECGTWNLPLRQEWEVYYGTPGRVSRKSTSSLLHFGVSNINSNPTKLTGINIAVNIFQGLLLKPHEWIFDPCMGIGLTSRIAHDFNLNCIGAELNPKRLEHTVKWLLKQGYKEIQNG
jgi:hypothetical protein